MANAKAKTHKGIKGRIKVTKTGKILHRRTGKRHLMSSKGPKRRRQLRRDHEFPAGECKILRRQYNLV